MKKPSVFISYAREDESIALDIHSFLKEIDCEIWMDKFSLIPGQDWQLEIQEAIENSDIFIACLSDNSVSKRGFVQKELKKALSVLEMFPDGEIYLIPLRINNCIIPSSLSTKQWLDWNAPQAKNELKKAIDVSFAQIVSRNPLARQIKDMVKHETENWLSTGTYISAQRLAYIYKHKNILPIFSETECECLILSLIKIPRMKIDKEWENIVFGLDETVIFKLLKEYRYKFPVRSLLFRVLGSKWNNKTIMEIGNADNDIAVEFPKGLEKIQDTRFTRLFMFCLYSANSAIRESAINLLSNWQETSVEILYEFTEFEEGPRVLDEIGKVLENTGRSRIDLIRINAENGNEITRWLTARSLGKWSDVPSGLILSKMLEDASPKVVTQAVVSVGDRKMEELKEELLVLYSKSTDPVILQQLAITFGKIGLSDFKQALLELVESSDEAAKSSALSSITALFDREEEIELLSRELNKLRADKREDSWDKESYYALRLCQLNANSEIDSLPIKCV